MSPSMPRNLGKGVARCPGGDQPGTSDTSKPAPFGAVPWLIGPPENVKGGFSIFGWAEGPTAQSAGLQACENKSHFAA